MEPFVVVAEFACTEDGWRELERHLDRTLREVRATPGCLHAASWTAPGRRIHFLTYWDDPGAVARWVDNAFHREVLMPGFRRWCREGWFGDLRLVRDHDRARRCPACGRWSRARPGFDGRGPTVCRHCSATLDAGGDAVPGAPS
jgi:hypothetical protein